LSWPSKIINYQSSVINREGPFRTERSLYPCPMLHEFVEKSVSEIGRASHNLSPDKE